MFGHLEDDSERKDLSKLIRHYAATISSQRRQALLVATAASFEGWKVLQADANGLVTIDTALGLLGNVEGRKVPISEAKPEQCAGPFVTNQIDLAFKLWLESWAPFERVLQKYGLEQTFAAIGLAGLNTIPLRSLIRLSGLLAERLLIECDWLLNEVAEGSRKQDVVLRMTRNLGEGRRISAEKRRQRARDMTRKAEELAEDFVRHHPGCSVDEMVRYVRSFRDVTWAKSTAERKLKGVIGRTRRSMGTTFPRG